MNHKLPGEVFLESFYRFLDVVNKFAANNIAKDSLMNHTYEEANIMFNGMTKMNMSWHTKEAEVVSSSSTRKPSKEEIFKEEAKEKRMA